VTECKECGNQSSSQSIFHEIEVTIEENNSNLDGAIRKYLSEEKLEGANQYFCPKCSCKQNAN